MSCRHGVKQYTEDLAVGVYGFHLDKTIRDIPEPMYCLLPSLMSWCINIYFIISRHMPVGMLVLVSLDEWIISLYSSLQCNEATLHYCLRRCYLLVPLLSNYFYYSCACKARLMSRPQMPYMSCVLAFFLAADVPNMAYASSCRSAKCRARVANVEATSLL